MAQRIVIFDGPDSCGKSEMAKELSRRLGIPCFKNSDEHKYFINDPGYFLNAIRYVDTYFTSYLESSGASIILDRAWPSEWIYSQALGRKTDFDLLRELDNRHAKLGTVIVVPRRSNYARIRDDYESISSNIIAIDRLYGEFIKWTNCKVIELNVDDEDLEREIQEIMKGMES
jgi:thymidylate kinase